VGAWTPAYADTARVVTASRPPSASSRAGAFDVVDPALGALLGRPPVALRDFLAGAWSR
jgi:hypothetical protein